MTSAVVTFFSRQCPVVQLTHDWVESPVWRKDDEGMVVCNVCVS
jgi:hypothetical protein